MLPPIVRTREHVRLCSPLDPAIDMEAMGRRALAAGGCALDGIRAVIDDPTFNEDPKVIGAVCLQRYSSGDDTADDLMFKADQLPTWFHIRGLNQAELNVASLIGDSPPDDENKAALYQATTVLRVALDSVEGWEGWERDRRETRYSVAVWQLEPILHIPPAARMFLGAAALNLSVITEKKSASSGS